MFTSGLRRVRLERKAFLAKDTPSISLKNIPAGHRIRGIELNLDLTFTQGGAAALITGDQLARLYAQVKVGKRLDTTGQCIRLMTALMQGGEYSLPADIPATNAGVFKRNVRLYVPYANDEANKPGDTAPKGEVLRDLTLDLKMDDPLALFTSLASVTGTLRPWLIVEPERSRHVAAPLLIQHKDFTSQSIDLLRSGIAYECLFLFKENGASFTSAEVSSIQLKVDGETVYDDLDLGEIAAQFNALRALGTSLRATSATAPVGFTALNDQQNPAAAGSGFTLPFIPLIVDPKGASARRLARVQSGVQINTQGTLTSFRVGYRAREMQTGDQVRRAAIKSGYGNVPATGYNPADPALASDPQAASLAAKTV